MKQYDFENDLRFYNEPTCSYNLRPTHYRSVFEIRSKLSYPYLIKKLRAWESVLDQSRWSREYPTDLSIKIANRNVRKIKMLLMVIGQYDLSNTHEFNKVGRIQFSGLTRHYIFQRSNFRCAECGVTNKESSLHIDHIVPIIKGGSNRIDNLQVLCKTCNLAKHTNVWEAGK